MVKYIISLARTSLPLQKRLAALSHSLKARFMSADRRPVYEASAAGLSISIDREDVISAPFATLVSISLAAVRTLLIERELLEWRCTNPTPRAWMKADARANCRYFWQAACPSTYCCNEATLLASSPRAAKRTAATTAA